METTIPLSERYPIKSIEGIYFNWRLKEGIDSIYAVNIANLKKYYDLYGPEQRDNALELMLKIFSEMEKEGNLLCHARYDLDKVMVASSNNSVDEKASEIKDRILQGEVELIKGLKIRDIDPKKIEVYIGAASGDQPIRTLIDLAIEAEKHAKNSPNKIYIIKK